MEKVTGQCPQTTIFLKRKESRSGIEPRSLPLPTLPLGQTGSPVLPVLYCALLYCESVIHVDGVKQVACTLLRTFKL